jgi:hypothetical protein
MGAVGTVCDRIEGTAAMEISGLAKINYIFYVKRDSLFSEVNRLRDLTTGAQFPEERGVFRSPPRPLIRSPLLSGGYLRLLRREGRP